MNDANNINYGVTGLAFHPVSNLLYGSTDISDTPGTEAKLVTINIMTMVVTVIGPFNVGNPGQPATMSDIAFDSVGNLYGVGSNGGPHLYSIDIATGQATRIGDSGLTTTDGGGLAISPAGVFYGTPTANSFGTYDPVSGAFTHIANPHKPIGGWYGALAFDAFQLYGINTNGLGNPSGTHLVTIDPETGAVVDLGTSRNSVDSIAFGPEIVPEPASWVFALVGLAGLIGWHVRVAHLSGRAWQSKSIRTLNGNDISF